MVTDSPGAPVVDGVVSATADAAQATGCPASATFVEDPGPDGWFLLTAAASDGPAQFLVRADEPGLRVEPLGSLDITRRFVALDLDARRRSRIGARRNAQAAQRISSTRSWRSRAS